MQMRAMTVVPVPAAEAWVLVGERFGDIGTWAATVSSSSMDGPVAPGAVRTCHVRGFGPMPAGVVRERLITFDPVARSLSYAGEGLPSFITGAVNRWSVHPQGEGSCVVRVHATLTVHPLVRPFGSWLRRRMGKDAAAVLEELVHHLVTGRPHARKVAADHTSSTVR